MLVTALIVGVSIALFVYWFRYTVVLILRTPSTPEYAHKVAAANHLSFVDVQQELYTATEAESLARLRQALERDYGALKYLLGYAATVQAGSYTAEQRLLMFNFGLMRLWCRAMARVRPSAARLALLEMSGTLEYFANAMGRRFASLSADAAQA